MALRRNSRSQRRRRAVTSSAQRVKLEDRKTIETLSKRREEWHDEAWAYYDEFGFIKQALNLKADAVSQVRVFVGVQEIPDEDPIPIDDVDGQVAGADEAQAALERLDGTKEGIKGILRELSINLDVPGECYLLGEKANDEDFPEAWDIKSTDEVRYESGKAKILRADGKPRDQADSDFLLRIWRPHPRFSDRPDSNMRSVLSYCESLLLLDRMVRAQAKSRLNAGILLIASELSFGPSDPTQDESHGEAEDDVLDEEMMEALVEPIHDEGSASAVVPYLARVPADLFATAIQHITLDRPIDEQAMQLREELRREIVNGLNIPASKVFGMENMNHWSAWLEDDQFVTAVKPDLSLMMHMLSVGYLWDVVTEAGVSPADAHRLRLWFDPAAIVVKPNRTQDAKDAHERLAISDAALRRELDFSEEDAPDDEELERRVGLRRGIITELLTRELLRDGGLPIDTGISEQTGETGTPEAGEGDDPSADDRRDVPETSAPGEATVAAGAMRYDRLAERLAEIDRNLLERLALAADAALADALARAGARARSAASRDSRSLLAGVPARDVTVTLGASRIAALGLSEEELLTEAFDDLEARYDDWVGRAQEAAREAVLAEAAEGTTVTPTDQEDEDRSEGWLLLSALLLELARERLFSPAPGAPEIGEFDPTTSVPPGIVRKSLQRAGGSVGTETEATILLMGGRPAGMVATGERVRELVAQALRASFGGWRWVYGDPALRQTAFPPHRSLDGVEFDSWEADVLVNGGSWPPVSHFHPGDHLHCKCTFVPAIEARIAEAA